jgi:hypothetical protein
MRNLLDRLKPEHIQKLKEAQTLYPSTIPFLFMELQSNTFWSELTYSCIFTLLSYLDIYNYSPSTIENLFINEEH